MTKNEQIKKTGKETRNRHKAMDCKVYKIKIDRSHLSNEKLNFLRMLFIEAKWIYNYQLSTDIFKMNYKQKNVELLNKDKIKEPREIKFLSAQMRQALVNRMKINVLSLSRLKKSGHKIGGLKFKSRVYSIPLSQYGVTYKLQNKKYIKIQGYKTAFRVNGLDQIPSNAEYANANLTQRNGDYYLKITTFVPKVPKVHTGKSIGLDFGIKDNIVDSNGVKTNFQFPETKQLKKASRKFNKCKNGSKNKNKIKFKLQKQYESIDNQKKDAKNKFIHKLVSNNDLIAIQDESIGAWKSSRMKGFGRKIQRSIMGGIISDLKKKSETVIVPKYFPSTQLCYCGAKKKLSLNDRIYRCDNCGITEDRDVHSAKMILNEAIKISTGCRNTMPIEEVPLPISSVGPLASSFVEVGSYEAFSSW